MEYTFQYKLTEDEYENFNVYGGWSAPWLAKERLLTTIRTALYIALFIIAINIIFSYINKRAPFSDRSFFIFAPVLTIAATAFSIVNAPSAIKKRVRKFLHQPENSHILGERMIVLNNEGIQSKDKNIRMAYQWNAIKKFAVTKEHFYLFTNTYNAILLPKRLLSSQEEIDEMDRFLTENIPISATFRSMGF